MAEGIFCLETAGWDESVKGNRTSMEHFLRFLEVSMLPDHVVPYQHFDVATREEFEFYLTLWEKKFKTRFPVLLLAFHGGEGGLEIFKDKELFSTDELVEHLISKRYHNAIIHFSSCYLIEPEKMDDLLKKTGALSVSGYMDEKGVDWYPSAAFELLYLAELFAFEDPETKKIGLPIGSRAMRDFVCKKYATNEKMVALGKALSFNLYFAVDFKQLGTDRLPEGIHSVDI